MALVRTLETWWSSSGMSCAAVRESISLHKRLTTITIQVLRNALDRVERKVEFEPSKEPYDPRFLLGGQAQQQKGKRGFLSGFFDRNSVVETLAGWAKTVVTARARLGGIPIGAIVSECRTVQTTHPADPAAPETGETVITQPGQVWFPDSAWLTVCLSFWFWL